VNAGRQLVKNTILNILGQAIPLLVAVFSLPPTILGLGAERFGILSLAWVLVGYFSLFDLGLGRATTKFVAEAMSRGEDDRIGKIVWTSLATQVLLGLAGGAALAIATPVLAGRVLKTPPELLGEMRAVLYLLSLAIPILVCSRNLRGLLEAAQRFDLINAIRIPLGVLTFMIPLAGALAHVQITYIVAALILAVVASTVAYLVCCVRIFPAVGRMPSVDRGLIRPLLIFGGWVTISNILVPILVYLDRFLISAIVSVTALTYYTAPYEVASRLLIFPAAMSTTLFPAFSALSAVSREDLISLYVRSLKYIVLTLGPVAFIGVFFAGDILRVWLGADFAAKSGTVFAVLSVGMVLNALSQMPANLLDSVGRPDLRTKVFLSYVLVYAGLVWFLISGFGIVGAALAWALRGGLECVLFFVVSERLLRIGRAAFVKHGLLRAAVACCGFVILSATSLALVDRRPVQATMAVFWILAFAVYVWRYVLDDDERGSLSFGALNLARRGSA
jgi:O-antigen/teichoic acid export membrane protein